MPAHAIESIERNDRRKKRTPRHIEVTLSPDPESVLAQDIWDLRQLKAEYPKHLKPSHLLLDFSWIKNQALRQQVKLYFRTHLPSWKPATCRSNLWYLKISLIYLPPDIHVGTLNRNHVESLLSHVYQSGSVRISRCLRFLRMMLEYMANAPAWTGPRPSRFLIWREDVPPEPHTLPRPIPPDVLDQLDALMEQAIQAMLSDQVPLVMQPAHWDALLILRRTGMRFEDLAHLKAPDEHGRNGCLDQDSDGYWWLRIDHRWTKMSRDHRIPTRKSDGTVDAIHRQRQRSKEFPDHFGENYLFRTRRGILTLSSFDNALTRLASHLLHEGLPYKVTPHQFRHTIATDMIEQGVDIYTVKEFLGHASLAMTERYVRVYLKSLKAKYDAYRVKKQETASIMTMESQVVIAQEVGKTDGGWVEDKVGKLYVSPLPDGIGNCVHLPMLDPCPTPPHCPTCPKLRATMRHLPIWETKARNLLITVEALRDNPAYSRARQKHEQELAHAENVIKTIKEEGMWDGHVHTRQALQS